MFGAEPALAFAGVDLSFIVGGLAGHVVDALAAAIDVPFDVAVLGLLRGAWSGGGLSILGSVLGIVLGRARFGSRSGRAGCWFCV